MIINDKRVILTYGLKVEISETLSATNDSFKGDEWAKHSVFLHTELATLSLHCEDQTISAG